jgi:hypothetical protein
LVLLRQQLLLGHSLLLLLGFASLHLQGLFDHPIGEGIEVSGQGALQFLEFWPLGVELPLQGADGNRPNQTA